MKSDQHFIFDLPPGFGMDDLRGLVSGNHGLEEEPVRHSQRQYLDTFDWRLFGAGNVLDLGLDSTGQSLCWRRLVTGEVLLRQSLPKLPRFASDFNAPAIRARLGAVTGVRALHPKVSVLSDASSLRLLDAEHKTMVRLELRKDQILLPQSIKQISLPTRLYVFPYRGYSRAAGEVLRALNGKHGLSPAREDPLVCALNALGLKAGEYSSNLEYPLTPVMPAATAVANILLKLLDHLEANLDGTCRDLDTEFLHDLRAAATRSELLLRKLPVAFPGVDTRRFREEFSWLEKVTRQTRQLDVYLLLLEEYEARLPAGQGSYLEPFRSFLRDHKQSEHRELTVALKSPRFRRLAENWRLLLTRERDRPATPSDPGVEALAASLLAPAYRQLLELGSRIHQETPAEELINLRKACKELGYLLEFFHQLFPRKKLKKVTEPLFRLRVNLEEFEDLELQQQRLRTFIAQMREEQRLVQQAALEAMNLLIGDMAQREIKVRKAFAKRFAKFASANCQTRFQALFPRDTGPQPETP